MVRISKSGSIARTLRKLAQQRPDVTVVVSYSAEYAVHVHENLDMSHPNGGQAKFLEQPAREMRKELQQGLREDVKRGMSVEAALYKAGLKLQAASQKLVPVDTGILRASAQTTLEKK
jgi:hypothetical protein